jgi:hypothetical protein
MMAAKGLVDYYWQTYAWSKGQVADHIHKHQYKNGDTVAGVHLDWNDIKKIPGAWNDVEEKATKDEIPPYVPTNHGVIAKVKVLVDDLNIRVAPDTKAAITRKAKKGEVFNVFANVNDWHNVGGANWVFGNNGKYLSLVKEDPKPEYPGHPIKNGSTNTLAIKEIQKEVGVTSDGVWGPKTDAAVKTFQKKHGLAADGIVGPKTWAKCFKKKKPLLF